MDKQRRQPTPALPLETHIVQSAPAAFDSVRAEIAAVPADALASVNLEIPRAARRALVVADRLAPLMPELAKLHDLDLRAIERLRIYALALLHAQALVDLAEEEATPLSVLVAEATPLRASLIATVEMLAHFGLISIERVEGIRRTKAYADLAAHLLTLALVLREVWDEVKNRVCVSRADVDRAVALSAALSKALGIREASPDPLAEPSDCRFVRAQAYTLFVRAYDECRRAVTYLRWHDGDVMQIVPSLRPRRARRARGESTEGTPKDDSLDSNRVSEVGRGPSTMPFASTAADALAGA